MIARRPAPWCFATACLLAALLPAPALAQKKGDSGVLKIWIYRSLVPGAEKANAKSFTQPMCDFLGNQIDLDFKCDVHEGTTAKELFEFGKKLNGGEYHLGAVMGVEYGWLREKYPKLKILVAVSFGENDTPRTSTHLYVHKDSPFKKLGDLKGKQLADYKDTPLMDRMFLRQMLRDEKLDPKGFLVKSEPFASAKSAAVAVRNGKADCVVMNSWTYLCLKNVQPGLAESLVELKAGPIYPVAVLIGSPEVVDGMRKRKGLWADLREHFIDVHNFSEGRECISFWHFQSFVPPDDDLQRKIDEMARKLPVKELLTLE